MPDWTAIVRQIQEAGIQCAADVAPVPIRGGDTSSAWRLPTCNGDLFVKTGPEIVSDGFAAEADGLIELAGSDAVAVPEVVAHGCCEGTAYLALEWLKLEVPDARCERLFGEQLANLHRVTSEAFGWHRDNAIGLTPQQNNRCDDWLQFYAERRLGFQLRLADENGYTADLQRKGAQLLTRLPTYFDRSDLAPSLLHGDLWGGNWGCSGGRAVVFDPAVYYGDRETDIAMTRLFGGFGVEFYAAYKSSWPLADGHVERQSLYQLYHVLNHLNIFGSAYLGKAIALIDKLL